MLWDQAAKFSDGQAVIATALSDNIVRVPSGDVGKGRHLPLQVDAGGYAGAGTLSVEVQTGDSVTGNAIDSPVTIATYAIDNASLLRGGPVLVADLPTGCRRYLRLNYTGTGALTAGALTAGLVLEGQTNR